LAGSAAFGLLLYLTPSASDAVALVRAQAKAHRVAYPGPIPPQRYVEALVATEDHRFYSPFDPGLDPFAVVRVIVGALTTRRDQGGATIEQQLAKMLYTPGRHGFRTETEQIAIAIKLSLSYSKPEILRMYAEVAYFGSGYYGLAKASCGYFGKTPADLTWPQAAMLAGVVNEPSVDDPRRNLRAARKRERHVFARLVAVGDLTRDEAQAALSQPLGVVPRTIHSACR
jgi:membrane peptidoglycan carboxypeptidase